MMMMRVRMMMMMRVMIIMMIMMKMSLGSESSPRLGPACQAGGDDEDVIEDNIGISL